MRLGILFDEFDSLAWPDGPPDISFPFKGDSIPGIYPVVILSGGVYISLPLGTGHNNQQPNQNALAFVIEQEFIVRAASYVPMPLNTPYSDAWSLGWAGPVDLSAAILVSEGELKMMDGGLGKVRRHFASIPPQRNSYESFSFRFPGIIYADNSIRQSYNYTVNSRLQYDYCLITDESSLPYIYPQFVVYEPVPNAVLNGNMMADPIIQDPLPLPSILPGTVPPLTTSFGSLGYRDIYSNAEIVAEASKLAPWMGNIYERITRFVLAI